MSKKIGEAADLLNAVKTWVNTKLGGKANLTGAKFTGAVSIKGNGNAVTNISGASNTVDYAKLYVTGTSNTGRPLVINGETGVATGNVAIGNIIAPTNKLEVDGNIKSTGKLYSGSTEVSLVGHTHDDRYYTETEIDTKLSGKADNSDVLLKNGSDDYVAEGHNIGVNNGGMIIIGYEDANPVEISNGITVNNTERSGITISDNVKATNFYGNLVGNASTATNAQNAEFADYASVSDWNSLDNKPNTLNIQFTVGSSTYSYDVFYEEA